MHSDLSCERRLFPGSLGFCVILRSATRASLGLFSSQACDNAVHAGQRSAAQSECVAPACGLECGRRFEASERCAREAQEYEAESRNPCISDRNHFFLPTSCDKATLRRRIGMRRDDDHKTSLVLTLSARRSHSMTSPCWLCGVPSSWLYAVHLGCPQWTTAFELRVSMVSVHSPQRGRNR